MKNIDIKRNKDIEISIIERLIWYKYWYKYGFKNGYNSCKMKHVCLYVCIYVHIHILIYNNIHNYECKGNNNDMTDFEMNFLLS